MALGTSSLRDDQASPFGDVVELTSKSAVIRHALDSRTVPWLAHHSIGREVSTRDKALHALAVVPMAMSLELMAEAARMLAPESVVTRFSNVRAGRWLAFDNEHQTIEVRARREGGQRLFELEAQLLGDLNERGLPAVTAAIELAEFLSERRIGVARIGRYSIRVGRSTLLPGRPVPRSNVAGACRRGPHRGAAGLSGASAYSGRQVCRSRCRGILPAPSAH